MKGGENEMLSFANDRLRLVKEIRAEQIREAANARRFERPGPSIRRAVGSSLVRFGSRVAGEPSYELARSR
jgi:hypothetical protein